MAVAARKQKEHTFSKIPEGKTRREREMEDRANSKVA